MKEIIKGYWFLPNSDYKIPGEMYVEDGVIHLSLYKNLRENPIDYFDTYDTIWGSSLGGKEITLFKCLVTHVSDTVTHIASIAILGKHILSFEDCVDYDVEITNNLLTQWYRHPSVDVSYNEDSTFCCRQSPESKKERFIPIRPQLGLRLLHRLDIIYDSIETPFSICQSSVARLEYSTSVSLKTISLDIQLILEFFSLVILQKIEQQEFFLIDRGKPDHHEDQCQIFYSSRSVKTPSNKVLLKFLLDYHFVDSRLDKMFQRWFEEKDLRPIVQHLIECYDQKDIFTEYTFLNTIQAIDGCYTRFLNPDERISKIIPNVLEMFDYKFINISNDERDQLIDSRNYYSHLLPPFKTEKKLEGGELYKINCKIKPLLICLILHLFDFSHDEIESIVSDFTK